jgi:hypothetical protein
VKQFICVASIAACLTSLANAGDLRIVGQNVDWPSSSQPTLHYLLGIENVTSTSDLLCGWQMALKVVPVGDATGVTFLSASVPNNYVLGAESTGIYTLSSFSPPSAYSPLILDDVYPGVPVDQSGQMLLDVGLAASAGAHGKFEIAIVPGATDGASWFSEDGAARPFFDAPFSSTSVSVGTVTLTPVPEPSSVALLGFGDR